MQEFDLIVPPAIGFDVENLENHLRSINKLEENQHFLITRRSVDARQKQIKVNLRIQVDDRPIQQEFVEYFAEIQEVSNAPEILIIGAGPAGLFAGIKAIENGFKPIILERGKDVQTRRRDLAAINKEHIVNPDSNYCFGEGGAGTYSDGKLYTRSKKRGSIRRVFEIFVAHGAPENILVEAHPHIGTNKLPKIVTALRESIEAAGGQILFNARVTDFILEQRRITGVVLADNTRLHGIATIVATGHSARDIFRLCHHQNIPIESKPFALGVRVEHPQEIIDKIQYHCDHRGPYLPASSYGVVAQTHFDKMQRGVFSFCMCPGGFIVPAATQPGEIVVNGMSPSRRDSRYANSGIVVAVEHDDIRPFQKHEALAMMEFQASVEKSAWEHGGQTQQAPAQRLVDFMNNNVSGSLNETSYQPGLTSSDMREVLPTFIHERLKQGFKAFGKKMKGYLTNEAQIVGVESRTSSPVRIPRDPVSLEHPQIENLFPCGEGAGYAGGIASAAMDGERIMEAIIRKFKKD